MFSVLLGKKPQKEFRRLDEKTRKKLDALFEALEVNPWPAREFDLAKIENMADCFRIRVKEKSQFTGLKEGLKKRTGDVLRGVDSAEKLWYNNRQENGTNTFKRHEIQRAIRGITRF